MTNTKLLNELGQLSKKCQKALELLERELEGEREQAESAQAAREEARTKIAGLEARRSQLAAEIFSGKVQATKLEDLDKELGTLRQSVEIATLAEEQAAERAEGIKERIKEAEHEATERRYDLYAVERKAAVIELDKTLDSLTSQLDALLEIDQGQRREEGNLGLGISDMPFAELLDGHLSIKLAKYIRAVGPLVSRVDMNVAHASLLKKDWRTQTRSEQQASVAADLEAQKERTARLERAHEAATRVRAYKDRRNQLRAHHGYNSKSTEEQAQKIDEQVDLQLAKEFPDLAEEEQLARLEEKQRELRGMLLGPDEDYEALSEERRVEVDAAVEEWLVAGGMVELPALAEGVK